MKIIQSLLFISFLYFGSKRWDEIEPHFTLLFIQMKQSNLTTSMHTHTHTRACTFIPHHYKLYITSLVCVIYSICASVHSARGQLRG